MHSVTQEGEKDHYVGNTKKHKVLRVLGPLTGTTDTYLAVRGLTPKIAFQLHHLLLICFKKGPKSVLKVVDIDEDLCIIVIAREISVD